MVFEEVTRGALMWSASEHSDPVVERGVDNRLSVAVGGTPLEFTMLQFTMLQFLRRDQRRLRLPRVAVDSQPCDLPMTNFSCLLQHKGAPIFQIKQPPFWKKRQICTSLCPLKRGFFEIFLTSLKFSC